MGWELRHGGKWYLYRNRRVNGRPVNPLAYMGQAMPGYETLWAQERPVTARWTGWAAAAAAGNSLPSARIN